MAKTDEERRMMMMKFIQGENVLELNKMMGRNIPYEEWDDKILNKREYYKHKKDPTYVSVELTEKLCKIPADYRLSNVPVLVEKRRMQDYHFEYTPEQLKNMYKTPKIIIDKFCNSFCDSSGIIERTSFYAVAPNAPSNIPALYRFSIATTPADPDYYTISMHAIVGGKEDGWLFLGRLDNDTTEPHKIAESEYSPKELKAHNAAQIECFTAIDRHIREKAGIYRDEELPKIYSIPFPHMHKPDVHYEIGDNIEECLPKFMRNCVYNSFKENVAYFMKMFNIYDHPHFRSRDEFLSDVLRFERKISFDDANVNAEQIVEELFTHKQVKQIIDEHTNGTKKSKNSHNSQKNKKPSNRRNSFARNKKEAFIQNKNNRLLY